MLSMHSFLLALWLCVLSSIRIAMHYVTRDRPNFNKCWGQTFVKSEQIWRFAWVHVLSGSTWAKGTKSFLPSSIYLRSLGLSLEPSPSHPYFIEWKKVNPVPTMSLSQWMELCFFVTMPRCFNFAYRAVCVMTTLLWKVFVFHLSI